jgi:hypothetical protein
MLFYKVEVRPSPIAGRGLFSKEAISKGAIIGLLAHATPIMTEEEYQEAQRHGEQLIILSAVRLAGKYFIYGEQITDEEYINHSADPTMLYHCGIAFARKDVAVGDELTVDYKYFLARDDVGAFDDVRTGGVVTGLDGRQAMIESCRELLALLAEADFDEPRHSDYGDKPAPRRE